MHNKVVFRAASALNDAGVVTLRINFRGVGQSTGTHDEGEGEREDVLAGLDYLSTTYPGKKLILCGFSFGSRVGMEVGINDERVSALISIGTPVDKYSFSFIESCRKPILFVQGENDEYGRVQEVESLAERLKKQTEVEIHVVRDADHFFEGQLDELKQVITDWTERHV